MATLINDHLVGLNKESGSGLEPTKIFDVQDMIRLHHFQNATCGTIGSLSIQRVYKAEIIKLAVNVRGPFQPSGKLSLT